MAVEDVTSARSAASPKPLDPRGDGGDAEDADESARLLLLQFCVADMSIELQSQAKSVAELQV